MLQKHLRQLYAHDDSKSVHKDLIFRSEIVSPWVLLLYKVHHKNIVSVHPFQMPKFVVHIKLLCERICTVA